MLLAHPIFLNKMGSLNPKVLRFLRSAPFTQMMKYPWHQR